MSKENKYRIDVDLTFGDTTKKCATKSIEFTYFGSSILKLKSDLSRNILDYCKERHYPKGLAYLEISISILDCGVYSHVDHDETEIIIMGNYDNIMYKIDY